MSSENLKLKAERNIGKIIGKKAKIIRKFGVEFVIILVKLLESIVNKWLWKKDLTRGFFCAEFRSYPIFVH